MHSPQRTHRSWKAGSGRAPGLAKIARSHPRACLSGKDCYVGAHRNRAPGEGLCAVKKLLGVLHLKDSSLPEDPLADLGQLGKNNSMVSSI